MPQGPRIDISVPFHNFTALAANNDLVLKTSKGHMWVKANSTWFVVD